MEFLGIEHKFSLAYTPAQNRLVERYYKTLNLELKSDFDRDNCNWYSRLGLVLLSLRNNSIPDIGFTMNEIVVDRDRA